MTTKWNMDTAHSEVQFKVKHLMITNVTGHFKSFTASAETEGDDFTTAKVHFEADIDSVETNNAQRDAHLRTSDFFDATNHPKMVFESTSVEKVDDENYKLNGNLTMRGVSQPVSLDVEFGGMMQDPWGNTRAGFTLQGKVKRKDFGVSFGLDKVAESGSLMLSDEVKINCSVEMVKEAVAELA